jgi:hypothetical protein
MTAVAHNEQTDAMTLWVAERTLRQYGLEELANDLTNIANEIAQGRIPRQNSWPLSGINHKGCK